MKTKTVNVEINSIQANYPKVDIYSRRTFAKTAKYTLHLRDMSHTYTQQRDRGITKYNGKVISNGVFIKIIDKQVDLDSNIKELTS
ncbi:hypothetical protein [Shewanella atlantica]|uniref:hypothetical protein n=1 Tax=Shewanella atlantica TaxID=271099 RepID=UPI003735BD87